MNKQRVHTGHRQSRHSSSLASVLGAVVLFAGCAMEAEPADKEVEPGSDLVQEATAQCALKQATLRTVETFEAFPFQAFTLHTYPGSTVTRSTRFARKGVSSMRATVGDPQLTPEQCTKRRYRGEVQANDINVPWDDGVSHWWGASFNPTSFAGEAYSLLQLHAPIPYDKNCDYDGNSISLVPRRVNGVLNYQLAVIERGGRSAAKGAGSNTTVVWSEPMRIGTWTDFVFNFTLSTNKRGYFRVWRNGQLIYSATGLTNVNPIDSCGVVIPPEKRASKGPSVGIYGPSCLANQTPSPHFREVYIDEVRTARGPIDMTTPNGYGVVAPECQ